MSRPTSIWKGRGDCGWLRASECAKAFAFEPTSLKRGEGLVSGGYVWLAANRGSEREGSGGGERTNINRDAVDV